MDYTSTDALKILFRCGVKKSIKLSNKLKKGSLKCQMQPFFRKLEMLNNWMEIEDKRAYNSRPVALTDNNKDRMEDLLEEKPELSAPEIKRNREVCRSPLKGSCVVEDVLS